MKNFGHAFGTMAALALLFGLLAGDYYLCQYVLKVYATIDPQVETLAAIAAARRGYGLRFGALEFNSDYESLCVRMDSDATEDTISEAAARVFDRAIALAREVSSGWRLLCQRTQTVDLADDLSSDRQRTESQGDS